MTCLMAQDWADQAKACRADAACMADAKGRSNVETWEGDVAVARSHFGCRLPE